MFLTKEGERRKVADTPNNAHTHRGTHSARQNTHKTREERVRGLVELNYPLERERER